MSATPELEEMEDELRQWQGAYPLAMFPEPDLKRAAAVLKDAGMTLDSISASNMRHVVGCIVPKALPLFAALRARDAEIAELREAVGKLSRCLLPVTVGMAQLELMNESLADDAVVLSFMGSGASDQVTAGEVRAALESARTALKEAGSCR